MKHIQLPLLILGLAALSACASPRPPVSFSPAVLELGSRGPEVAALQESLNRQLKPSPGLTVNGEYGVETKFAVVRFQRENGLRIDGLAGPQVKAALAPDVDLYFVPPLAVSGTTAPQVITRNVLQDRDGDYWLATWNGVVHYDGTTFTNVTERDGLRRHRVFCLLEDRAGDLWFGTIGAGVYRFDGRHYTNYTKKDGLGSDTVLWMTQDRENNIWFGGAGLTKYDGSGFSSFGEKQGFTNSDVHSIAQAPDGRLWLGTRGALFHYDGKTFVNFTEKHDVTIDGNSYTPAMIDGHGHVWFGGSRGIYHYDGESVRQLFQPSSFSLLQDSRGRIWFTGGTLNGQVPPHGMTVLNRLDPAAGLDDIAAASQQIAVNAGAIFGLTEDRDGSIWFGTGAGIGRTDGVGVHYYERADAGSLR